MYSLQINNFFIQKAMEKLSSSITKIVFWQQQIQFKTLEYLYHSLQFHASRAFDKNGFLL